MAHHFKQRQISRSMICHVLYEAPTFVECWIANPIIKFTCCFQLFNFCSSLMDSSSIQKDSELIDSKKWTSQSPTTESPKSNKKKKKGYQHLSSSSDEDGDDKRVQG